RGWGGGPSHRREERVYLRPGDEPELVVVALGAGEWMGAAEPARVGGGEGQEQVTGEVRADGAGARDAVGDPPGQSGALVREQRRVGGHDADHRAARRRGRGGRAAARRAGPPTSAPAGSRSWPGGTPRRCSWPRGSPPPARRCRCRL